MNPFKAQQRAFALGDAGEFTEATQLFIEALKDFRKLLTDERMRAIVVQKAGAIPDQMESAEEIADQFLQQLPGWLRELHFDSFYTALTSYEVKPARMHWALLVSSAEEIELTSTLSLDLLRQQVCQRRQVTHKAIEESGSDAQAVLDRAEGILVIDADNNAARRVAIAIYNSRVKTALERLTGKPNQQNMTGSLSKLSAGKRQRLHDSRKTVRRLRQHLRRARSRADADVEEMVKSYKHLSHYHLGLGELESSIKLARRARRLRPEDEDLRSWARGIRRLRRRG